MRPATIVGVVLLALAPVAGSAAGRGEIVVEVPAAGAAGASRSLSVCIAAVVDNRSFEERPAEANIPSVAEGGVASLTPERRAVLIGRVRDGNGKARNNLFTGADQPVEAIVRQAVGNQLTAMGYTLVADAAAADVTVEVSIDRLWGYILIEGGGWGGGMPTMAGELATTLTSHGPGDTSGRFQAAGTARHGFGVMTGKHWSLMFGELLTSYMKDLATISF